MVHNTPSTFQFHDGLTLLSVAHEGLISSAEHHEVQVEWSANLFDEADGRMRARTTHRRTYSAPPALKHLHITHDAPVARDIPLAGKRAVRSPRVASGGVGAAGGQHDPFHDIRSPVYKKSWNGEPNGANAGAEEQPRALNNALANEWDKVQHGGVGGAGSHFPRARSQSLDAAMFDLQRSDLREGRRAAVYKCRRCGGGKRNHVCGSPEEPPSSGETARDSKTIPWTSAEDKIICEGVAMHGYKWSLISNSLLGRTDNAVRNRWHRLEQARRWREEVQAQYAAAACEGTAMLGPMPGSAYPGYKCRRCGQPKRGHVCPYEDAAMLPAAPAAPAALAPQASSRTAKAGAHRTQASPGDGKLSAFAHMAVARIPPALPGASSHQADAHPSAQPRGKHSPTLHRPASSRTISVVPPITVADVRLVAAQLPTPSPRRYLLDHLNTMPLSTHLRCLETGVEGEMINVGDLEDLIFGALPLDLSDLASNSPLKNFAFSPRRFRSNLGPPTLKAIPSGEVVGDFMPGLHAAMPGLERQSTPQAVKV